MVQEFIAQPHIIEQYLLQGERAPYLVDYDAKQANEVYRRVAERYNRIFLTRNKGVMFK